MSELPFSFEEALATVAANFCLIRTNFNAIFPKQFPHPDGPHLLSNIILCILPLQNKLLASQGPPCSTTSHTLGEFYCTLVLLLPNLGALSQPISSTVEEESEQDTRGI